MIIPFVSGLFITARIKVLLIFGQSNAEGTVAEALYSKFYSPNPNAYIMGWHPSQNISSFEVLDFEEGNALGATNGIECYVAYYYKEPIYIIKVVKGGTSLAVDWASGTSLRNNLITKINEAKALLGDVAIDWISYWNQGEDDTTNSTWANDYDTNYISMMEDVKTQTGIEFKHLIAELSTKSGFYINNTANADVLRQKQLDIVDHYKGRLIPSHGFGFHDGAHYDQIGQNIMAKRVVKYL
jgi:hypothetical protein